LEYHGVTIKVDGFIQPDFPMPLKQIMRTRIFVNGCKRTLRKHKTLNTVPLHEQIKQISQTSPLQDAALHEALFTLIKK
jgi:hypothetical protein